MPEQASNVSILIVDPSVLLKINKMRPRPINEAFQTASLSKAMGSLITPMITTEAKNEENTKKNCAKDEAYLDQIFIVSDAELEQRLNYLVSKFCTKKPVKQPRETKKLTIKPKELLIDVKNDEKQTDTALCVIKKPSTGALKSATSARAGVKKSVRFADTLGLELEHVKVFSNQATMTDNYFEYDDDLIPSPRRRVNTFPGMSSSSTTLAREKQQRYMQMRSPSRSKQEICSIVEAQNVCIESIMCTNMLISGLIRVKNVAFEKQVQLRYTLDEWHTYSEIPCTFIFSNMISNHDTFSFSFCLPLDLPVGICCEMCIRFGTEGQEFWDNNKSENYKLDCHGLL